MPSPKIPTTFPFYAEVVPNVANILPKLKGRVLRIVESHPSNKDIVVYELVGMELEEGRSHINVANITNIRAGDSVDDWIEVARKQLP